LKTHVTLKSFVTPELCLAVVQVRCRVHASVMGMLSRVILGAASAG
jgi:hypothetical protein